MTLARQERTANFKLALTTLLEAVGDYALAEVLFDPNAHPDILKTTWEDLEKIALIEPLPTGKYLLTGRGWTAALLTTGTQNEPWFKDRLSKLFSAMKKLVKGRHEPAIVVMRVLVETTTLPEGWIFNIIEGKYLEEVAKRRGASWVKSGRIVLIPVSFDIEPTDLNTLLQDQVLRQVEELMVDLEDTRADLDEHQNRYHCPFCGAELFAAGGYPIDQHSDGYFESFVCGYTVHEGQVSRLCPKDPGFPKLEDFDLTVHRTNDGQWVCWTAGKTSQARLVSIPPCPGRTEEEARRRVVEHYDWVARKTKSFTAVSDG